MMATIPHITSGSGLRKFPAGEFLFNSVQLFLPMLMTHLKFFYMFTQVVTLLTCIWDIT